MPSTPSSPGATFGGLLRQLRRRAGLTQSELALLVGFSVSQISLLEKGRRLPDVQLVSEKFAPALHLADEPHLLQRLLQLAAEARGERPPSAVEVQRTLHVQTTVDEEWIEDDASLPAALTPLVGREAEVKRAVTHLLQSPGRLVTLIGPPGVGKTRLALAVAEQLQPLLADGAGLIHLAAVSDSNGVAAAIAAALHLRDTGSRSPQQQLIDHLRPKEMLLVLDDFEHLLAAPTGAAVTLLVRLLESCPRLRLLVTSREPLRVRAEQRMHVQPLPTAAAVALFLRRAEAVEPDFAPTAEDLAAVAELCLRLDCLPLAIELMAARIDLYSPSALPALLYDRRLDLLADGPSDLPSHQRTLRRAMERSYTLLNADEQQVFRFCAVFSGSFDLEAVAACAAVAGETRVQSLMQSLVAKSLVKSVAAEGFAAGGERRFLLLETLRAYATEQLTAEEEAAVRRRHAHHYAARAQRASAGEEGGWSALTHDRPNLTPALHWLVQNDGAAALQMVAALRDFWYLRGLFSEGRHWAEAALQAASEAAPALRAGALLALGQMLVNQGETAAAQTMLAEAVELLRGEGDLPACARALIELGWATYLGHEEQAAVRWFEESLALAQELGDVTLAAHALTSLTHVLVYEGAYTPQLHAYVLQSIALYRQLQDAHGLAEALLNLCTFLFQTGQETAALAIAREALVVAESNQLASTRAWIYTVLAELLLLEPGTWDEAQVRLEAALLLFQAGGQRDGVLIVQHHLGDLAQRRGQRQTAADYYRTSHAAALAGGDRRMVARCLIGLGQVALAEQQRDEAQRLLQEAGDLLAALPAFLPPVFLAEFAAARVQAEHW